MSDPAPRRRYAKTAAQRERILDAAMEVFARRGERGSSLREIAERVGMSQAGLLHHFGSKDGLLLAVLERFDAQVQPERPLTGLDEALDFLRREVARGAQRPGLFHLQVTLTAESIDPAHPAHDHFEERYRRVTEQVLEPLEAAARSGAVRDDVDLQALSHLVIAAWDGLMLHRAIDDEVDVSAAFDLLLSALTGAIQPDPAPSKDT